MQVINQFNLAPRCAGSVLLHSPVCVWLTLRIVLRYASCLCLQILLRARKARTRLVSSPVLHCFSSCYLKQESGNYMHSDLHRLCKEMPLHSSASEHVFYLDQETTLFWETEVIRNELVGMSQDSADDCGLG